MAKKTNKLEETFKKYTVKTFLKLSKEQKKFIIKSISDPINKRIKRLEAKYGNTPLVDEYRRRGTISVTKKYNGKRKPLSEDELNLEFKRALKLYTAKTGTIKGYEAFINEGLNRLKERTGFKDSLTLEQGSIIFKGISKLQGTADYFISSYSSTQLQTMAVELMNDYHFNNSNELFEALMNKIDEQYIKEQEQENRLIQDTEDDGTYESFRKLFNI